MEDGVFAEYKENVLKELERLNKGIFDLGEEYKGLLVIVTENKVKSGIWGLIGAAIPVISAILLFILYSVLKDKGAPVP